MPRGQDSSFDPARKVGKERTLREHDDTFRSQPGWAMWHGGSSYAVGDPSNRDSYEYFANMAEAEAAMVDRFNGRGPNGLATPAVGADQEMHWHLSDAPWDASDPYPDARIYQNEPKKEDTGPSIGWERT